MPNVSEKRYSRRVELTLEPDLYSQIKHLAKLHNMSVNEMIREAIHGELDEAGLIDKYD